MSNKLKEGYFRDGDVEWVWDVKSNDWQLKKMEKPTFTQAMADAGELPPVGSEYLSGGVKFKSMCYGYNQAYKQVCVGKAENGLLEYHLRGMIKPIDTRTDEEKQFDKIYEKVGAETERDKEIVRDTLNASKPKDTSCSYSHVVIGNFPFGTFDKYVMKNMQ